MIAWAIAALVVLAGCTSLYLAASSYTRERYLLAQVNKLMADRESHRLELKNLLDQVDEMLERTEGKRRRMAATLARENAPGRVVDVPLDPDAARAAQRAQVRELLRRQGK